ncbi:MAG: helix-turn-helix domain-containing protein [Lachnospiraceae bacterium]|nr:helix-turn-helix domain-containing protein [Lachnospiraceae bacterium]
MEYLTTKELAEIWKISQRRIQMYCKEKRIKGAVLKGNIWLIPKDTEKPQDSRRHNTDN